jgi:hypothetical protein
MRALMMAAALVQASVMTIAQGTMSGVTEGQQRIVRTDAEWRACWKAHAAAEALPTVDFSQHMVAAVFLGTRPTGGFSVAITGTRREAETLVIEYLERSPGPNEMVSQGLTAPFHIVKLRRDEGPVRFESRTQRQRNEGSNGAV